MRGINTWPAQGWRCVRQLGEGSFAKVYEIARTEFGREYRAALKVITIPQSQADLQNAYSDGLDRDGVTAYFREIVEDIVGEIALMSQMKGNSNIVSYEDHMVLEHEGEIGWDILIRMELLLPLQSYLQSRPMQEEEVIRLGCDICRALELCQRRHIIHRDIKPENIFINEFGDFKLGDFGIARTVEHTMSNLSKKGTYTYMAPEVYLGKAYNQTVDIYSLGVVLYRYLNENRTPFLPLGTLNYRDREEAQRRRMAGEPVPPPCNGSRRLRAAVLRALSYHPEDRYQAAQEFRAALERCLVPEPSAPVASDPLPAPEPPPLEETEQGRQMLDRQRKAAETGRETPRPAPEPPPLGETEQGRQMLDRQRKAAEQGGTVNVSQPARPEPEQKSKPKRRPLWVIALAAVLVVALAVVFLPKDADPFEAWPELGEDAALRSFVTSALEDGLTVTGCDTGEDGKVKTIDFADAGKAEVKYLNKYVFIISEYNASGNRTKMTYYNADGSIDCWYTYEYDASENRIKMTYYNADGSIDCWDICEYDASGNLTKTTSYNADGSIHYWYTYEYDSFGNLTKWTLYNADGTIADVYES